jgi:hypothetical protein
MDEICPPDWPYLLWRVLQPPRPADSHAFNAGEIAKLDRAFAAISIVALASRLGDEESIERVVGSVASIPSDPMPAVISALGLSSSASMSR